MDESYFYLTCRQLVCDEFVPLINVRLSSQIRPLDQIMTERGEQSKNHLFLQININSKCNQVKNFSTCGEEDVIISTCGEENVIISNIAMRRRFHMYHAPTMRQQNNHAPRTRTRKFYAPRTRTQKYEAPPKRGHRSTTSSGGGPGYPTISRGPGREESRWLTL